MMRAGTTSVRNLRTSSTHSNHGLLKYWAISSIAIFVILVINDARAVSVTHVSPFAW